MLGTETSIEQIEVLRHQLGLDKPFHIQYINWLKNLLRGDLGNSIHSGRPVVELIKPKIPVTFSMVIFAAFISVIFGIPAGIISAVKQDTPSDYMIRVISLLGLAIPYFWTGLVALWIFGLKLRWFPVVGFVSIFDNFILGLRYMLLPSLAIGLSRAAMISRMTRSSFLETLRKNYIRTARAKGLMEKVVIQRHALKNALLPIITVFGLSIGGLLGGVVVIENIFTIPGIGRMVIAAIFRRDFPIIQAAILFIAIFFALINLIVDLSYAYINPRIRYN